MLRLQALEEVRRRHAQSLGDLEQGGGGDAVGAAFVLLHLLEADADGVAERGLGHLAPLTQHAHPRADQGVDLRRKILGFRASSHRASR